jgi:3-deoxy-D-manno-octulosonic-acid transferase
MIFILYVLSFLSLPFYYVIIFVRLRIKKEDKKRFQERFGISTLPKMLSPPLWFHAASVGETNAILPILKELNEQGNSILLTTYTRSSLLLIEQLKKNGHLNQSYFTHQFLPYDHPIFIRRFIKHWSPKTLYLTESEIWPFLIQEVHKKSIPIFLLNARMSQKSYKRFRLFSVVLSKIWPKIKKAWCQSEKIKEYLIEFGVKDVQKSPNMKFFSPKLLFNDSKYQTLKIFYKDCFIWSAVSTHEGEDEILLQAHRELKEHFLKLNQSVHLFLIPRHPTRSQNLLKLCNKMQLSSDLYSYFSSDIQNMKKSDTIIVDQFGILGLFFTLSKAVFVGGSFVPRGGHNPIEPWLFGCHVLFGKHMENFEDVLQTLDAFSFMVDGAQDLKERLIHIFLDQFDQKDTTDLLNLQKKIEKQKENKDAFIESLILDT